MSDLAVKHEHDDQISVYLNIEEDVIMAIGQKMEEINEEAYMNGYNWEAFLNKYLQTNHPELLEGIDTDSEAGTYVALFEKSNSNKADKLVGVINELVKNPEEIYSFLKANGEDIEWD